MTKYLKKIKRTF